MPAVNINSDDVLGKNWRREISLMTQEHKGRVQFKPNFESENKREVVFYLFYGKLEPNRRYRVLLLEKRIATGRKDRRGYEIFKIVVEEATKIKKGGE